MNFHEELADTIKKELPFTPTTEQHALIQKLAEFYVVPQLYPTFILNGYAGTGKTTLLSALVRSLSKLKRKTILLAPTGRAAKVFAQRAQRPAFTIHKKIYRKQTISGGGIQLLVAPNLHTQTLFIIDEASMIADYSLQSDGSVSSRNLLEDVINYVFSGKNCRLIFVGDNAQLPPVGSDTSPALNSTYLTQNYPQLQLENFALSHVLRQAEDSDILINATALRSAPINSYPKFTLRKDKGLYAITGQELQDELETAYSQYGIDDCIIITRSNKQANLYNHHVRGRLLWQEDEIAGGDLMMVVRNNYFWLGEQTDAGFIANGELIKIERLGRRETLYGFDFIDARIQLIDYPRLDSIEVKLMLNVIQAETPNLSRENMKALFFALEEDYSWEKNKKKRYERIMADPYFNALQVKFAYAITCHKSQGGQWSAVFIDQGFITEETLDHSYFRWLYTAITRSTEKVFLVNFHENFFN